MKITKDWTAVEADYHMMEVDHEIKDDKARSIGGRANITDHGEGPRENWIEGRYELRIDTLRDGKTFGAIRPAFYTDDLAVAKAEGRKRLERQGKGFARKARSAS